jgi:hypothetical protein
MEKGNATQDVTSNAPNDDQNTDHNKVPGYNEPDLGPFTPEETKGVQPVASSVESLNDFAQPGALYTKNDKMLRKRNFKCAMCNNDADDGHQCGACFRHVHGCCGEPWPGSEEGYGQVRMCGDCKQPDGLAGGADAASFTPEGPMQVMPLAPPGKPSRQILYTLVPVSY